MCNDNSWFFIKTGGQKSSCKDCKDRCINCHSTCAKYIAYKKDHDDRKAKLDNKKLVSSMTANY